MIAARRSRPARRQLGIEIKLGSSDAFAGTFGPGRVAIASARGCALGTVKSSLHRAAAAIRDYLGACDPPIKYPARERGEAR